MPTANIWLGLYYSTRDNVWRWSDSTVFDYGNILQPTANQTNPWKQNISIADITPNVLSCALMSSNHTFQWDIKTGDECFEPGIVICNHCDGKLIKSVLIHNQTAAFDEANHICDTEMGTNLLSIHNEEEYAQATRLCAYGTDAADDCWIGFTAANDNAYWTDGSPLDYAMNVSNVGEGECVALNKDDSYLSMQRDCSSLKCILCAVPSELCYPEHWVSLYDDECLITEECPYTLKEKVNVAKQWMNTNGATVIEYVFRMKQINIESGMIAVSIYNFAESLCDYYHVGITQEWNKKRLFLTKYYENVYHEIYALYINHTSEYHALRISVINGTHFDVQLNDVQYMSVNDTTVNAPQRDVSGFIGLTNYNLWIQSKSLYVSGTPFNVDTNQTDIVYDFDACDILETTLEPTSPVVTSLPLQTMNTSHRPHRLCVIIHQFETVHNITQWMQNMSCVPTEDGFNAINGSSIGTSIALSSVIFVCDVNHTKEVLTEYVQRATGDSDTQIQLNCTLSEDATPEMLEPIEKNVFILIAIAALACCVIVGIIFMIHRALPDKVVKQEDDDNDGREVAVELAENEEDADGSEESFQRKYSRTETEPDNEYHQSGYANYMKVGQPDADHYMIPIIRHYMEYGNDDGSDDIDMSTSSSGVKHGPMVPIKIVDSTDDESNSTSTDSAPINAGPGHDDDDACANGDEVADLLSSVYSSR
eukprot:238114_1